MVKLASGKYSKYSVLIVLVSLSSPQLSPSLSLFLFLSLSLSLSLSPSLLYKTLCKFMFVKKYGIEIKFLPAVEISGGSYYVH